MTEEEKTILLEIDKLYSELLNEMSGTWNGSYMMKPSGHNYRYKAQKLKDKFELYIMTERKHFFEAGFEVITKSDHVQDFKDYLLCYKKEQQHTDKMTYWCLKEDLRTNNVAIAFHQAGPISAEGIIEPLPLNTQTVYSDKEGWVFEG